MRGKQTLDIFMVPKFISAVVATAVGASKILLRCRALLANCQAEIAIQRTNFCVNKFYGEIYFNLTVSLTAELLYNIYNIRISL